MTKESKLSSSKAKQTVLDLTSPAKRTAIEVKIVESGTLDSATLDTAASVQPIMDRVKKYGRTITSDGWSNVRQPITNSMLVTRESAMFMKSVYQLITWQMEEGKMQNAAAGTNTITPSTTQIPNSFLQHRGADKGVSDISINNNYQTVAEPLSLRHKPTGSWSTGPSPAKGSPRPTK